MRMISFTETELGDPEGADEEDIASDPEDFHEPSLSLRAQRILAYTSATGWKDAVIPRNPQIVKRYNPQALVPKKPRNRHDDHPLVRAMMTRACQAVLDSEQELNAMDAANADGDLGRNMARAAQLVLQALNDGLLPIRGPRPSSSAWGISYGASMGRSQPSSRSSSAAPHGTSHRKAWSVSRRNSI